MPLIFAEESQTKDDPGNTGDIKACSTDGVILKLIHFYPTTLEELEQMRSKLSWACETCPTTSEVTAFYSHHPPALTQMLSLPYKSKPESPLMVFSLAGLEQTIASQAEPNPSISDTSPLESHFSLPCLSFPIYVEQNTLAQFTSLFSSHTGLVGHLTGQTFFFAKVVSSVCQLFICQTLPSLLTSA